MKIADISSWQGNINWEKSRKELEMVIFRASVGSNSDKKYVSYAKNCGLPFGVYHFYKAGSVKEAEQETQFFYDCATQENLKPLFFVLDIEYNTQTSKNTKSICEVILSKLKALGAEKVGLYIGQEKYPYIKDIKNKFDFIWIPRYGKNTGIANEAYKPIYPCDIWQYTDKGRINGINEPVDLNMLCGNKTLQWYTNNEQVSEAQGYKFFYLGRRTLRQGNEGKDVKELQQVLNDLDYNCGKVDGKFGAKTKQQVINFQKKNGLMGDGICGPKTINRLAEMMPRK